MARIASMETWVCSRDEHPGSAYGNAPFGSVCVLLRLTDEDGACGMASALATATPTITREFLHNVIGPVVLGREATEREAIWQDLYLLNRNLKFFPLYLTGPVDTALWDLAARRAGLPLFRYIGAHRTEMPYYASSQFLPTVADYLAEAHRYTAMGATAYKAHPAGDWREHIEIAEALRAEFPGLTLMLDPAGSDYSLPQAIAVARALEQLGFHWLEEPFHDVYIDKYAELCRTVDLPILASEAAPGGPQGIAEFIRRQAADILRTDVSWKWGVTGALKSMHLAEAFGLNCELHTTTMGLTDIANLHVACASRNTEYFELFAPHEQWSFPLLSGFDLDDQGRIRCPEQPGLGVDVDWDRADDASLWQARATAHGSGHM
jgi:L-alanine-DL-glutamate epimerase-like enolase superfamily enzyme